MQFDGEEIYRVLDQSRKLQEQVEALQEQMAQLRGEGTAADGLVRMTVTPGGAISDLQFDPRVMRMASMSLAEAVQAAHQAALADLHEKMQELNSELLGGDVAGLLDGSRTVDDLLGAVRATTDETLDRSLAELDRLRRSLLG